MINPNLPEDAYYIKDVTDAGKKVVIRSVGGLVQSTGTVVCGPFCHPYIVKVKVQQGKRKRIIEKTHISLPNWYVYVDEFEKCMCFMESELAGVAHVEPPDPYPLKKRKKKT